MNSIAMLDENQARMGGAIAGHARNLTENASTVERNQVRRHEELRGRLANVADNVAVLERNQAGMGDAIVNSTENLSNSISMNLSTVEQNQVQLHGELAEQLASVAKGVAVLEKNQAELGGGIGNNSNQIAAIAENVRKLQKVAEVVQTETRKAVARMAMIEQNQQNLQGTLEARCDAIASKQDDILKLASDVESIVHNLARLEEAVAEVCSNAERTTAKFALIESNQLNLQEQIEGSIRQVIESIEGLEQRQESVTPADSDEEPVPAEASIAAADDVEAAE
jgi:chromosome segregation ATPase